jgi:hypothetical protein
MDRKNVALLERKQQTKTHYFEAKKEHYLRLRKNSMWDEFHGAPQL